MSSFENMIELLAIENIIDRLSWMEKDEMINKLQNLENVYPLSDYEFIISNLLWLNKMTLIEYEIIREEYEIIREEYMNRNEYLDTFQMAWKSVWMRAEKLIRWWWHWLKRPSKTVDPNYSQQTSYDAYMLYEWNLIRVEIKASRVTEYWNDYDIFIDKALFSNTDKPFWMNFQQLKPQYCDVFIFIAIYRDKLKFWILSSDEVKAYWENEWDVWRFSPWQHSWNSWNEWQLHIRETNINDFDWALVEPENIKNAVIAAYNRQIKN